MEILLILLRILFSVLKILPLEASIHKDVFCIFLINRPNFEFFFQDQSLQVPNGVAFRKYPISP